MNRKFYPNEIERVRREYPNALRVSDLAEEMGLTVYQVRGIANRLKIVRNKTIMDDMHRKLIDANVKIGELQRKLAQMEMRNAACNYH